MQQEISSLTDSARGLGQVAGLAGAAFGVARAEASRARRRDRLQLRRLTTEDESRALAFLRREPVANFLMIGLMREHGVESRHNRGTFYGCTKGGELVGVGLLGEWFSTSGPRESLSLFARAARRLHAGRIRIVLLGEGEEERFERVFRRGGPRCPPQKETQVLLVKDADAEDAPAFAPLRPAESSELEEVAAAHVQACVESNGVNPLARDPEGFRRRLLARIRSGRVWVVCGDGGRVVFKTDIAVETDETAYLEAVWTAPELRGRGLGANAVGELSRRLLGCYHAVCLFADADKSHLVPFYRRLGFRTHGTYRLLRYE